MKAILDCNIWISFLIGHQAEWMGRFLTDTRFEVYVCDELLNEIHDVCSRPKIRSRINDEELDDFWHIGHFAGWKKRLVVQWVKLQAENIQSDVDGTNLVAIFVAQLKHSGALLGSNPVRNKLCNMTANRKPHP